MAVNDSLDLLLQDRRLSEDDWQALAEVLKLDGKFIRPTLPADPEERRQVVNRELRHSYGHTFMNVLRDEYEPDYEDIVRGTAQKLNLTVRDHHKLEDLENRILQELIDMLKAQIIKEEGEEAWQEIERRVESEIANLIEEGRFPPAVAEELRKFRSGALMASLLAGRLAGFTLYIVANQLFFAIAHALGLRIGVAVAGPIIGRTLAFILGPVGWAIASLWMAYDFGDTNWKKVLPAVIIVILLRQKLQFEEFVKSEEQDRSNIGSEEDAATEEDDTQRQEVIQKLLKYVDGKHPVANKADQERAILRLLNILREATFHYKAQGMLSAVVSEEDVIVSLCTGDEEATEGVPIRESIVATGILSAIFDAFADNPGIRPFLVNAGLGELCEATERGEAWAVALRDQMYEWLKGNKGDSAQF